MKIRNELFLAINIDEKTKESPLIIALGELSEEKSLPIQFSWDLAVLIFEIKAIQKTFDKARNNLIVHRGVKKKGGYVILTEGSEGYDKKNLDSFLSDHEKLCSIETKLKSKKPTLVLSELKLSGSSLSPGTLMAISAFVTLKP